MAINQIIIAAIAKIWIIITCKLERGLPIVYAPFPPCFPQRNVAVEGMGIGNRKLEMPSPGNGACQSCSGVAFAAKQLICIACVQDTQKGKKKRGAMCRWLSVLLVSNGRRNKWIATGKTAARRAYARRREKKRAHYVPEGNSCEILHARGVARPRIVLPDHGSTKESLPCSRSESVCQERRRERLT